MNGEMMSALCINDAIGALTAKQLDPPHAQAKLAALNQAHT
ncbi:hypothetical protein [Burkholderia sp. Nafp2/4-1b]|nr:hypothetical protein [Burkholderia sp. Nafp2/4-1b]